MEDLIIIIGVVGLSAAIYGSIHIFYEVKHQLREADDIIDRFKREKKKR
jgi:Tfp pilus assembly major pilin PilA